MCIHATVLAHNNASSDNFPANAGITNVLQAFTLRRPLRERLEELLDRAKRVKPRPRGWLLELPGVKQGRAERVSSPPLQELLGPNQVSCTYM